MLPDSIARKKLPGIIESINPQDRDYIFDRVNYYNKLEDCVGLNSDFISIKEFKSLKKSLYFLDLYQYLRFFPDTKKVAYLFGDIRDVPEVPSLLKSRPISSDNQNSVLINLDKLRHFLFIDDPYQFADKMGAAVWRGAAYQTHRKDFVHRFYNHHLCNVGQTNKPSELTPWQKPRMTIEEQLRYKYIISIEGFDVASNLKWIMSSNSVAIMPNPKFETWFMEGRLIPDYHYISVKDDFSDLESKIRFYNENPEKALEIIRNAHEYISQFRNKEREDLIALLVLTKYFQKSGQMQ